MTCLLGEADEVACVWDRITSRLWWQLCNLCFSREGIQLRFSWCLERAYGFKGEITVYKRHMGFILCSNLWFRVRWRCWLSISYNRREWVSYLCYRVLPGTPPKLETPGKNQTLKMEWSRNDRRSLRLTFSTKENKMHAADRGLNNCSVQETIVIREYSTCELLEL